MAEKPEEKSRRIIDKLLTDAGWIVQDLKEANITAGRGVAIREFPLTAGHGFADYLLYVDGAAAGVVEAKKEGETLTGYEIQTAKYSVGLPDSLKAYRRPLPFCYQSTGIETRFTNLLEPDARSRPVFAFHKPETLADWLMEESRSPGSTLRARLKHLPSGSTATPGMREGISLENGFPLSCKEVLSIQEFRHRRGGGAWVNSLENPAIVAEFVKSPYIESITYRRRCNEFWMESATSPLF